MINSKPTTLLSWTYRWEGAIFNAVCALYFLLLGPFVVEAASTAMRGPEGATVIWLGVLLLAISFAEIWAFPVKMRFVNEAIRHQGDAPGGVFHLWLFHAVISVILVMLIAESFGVEFGDESEMPWWMAIVLPATVLKELAFLVMLPLGKGGETAPRPTHARPSAREWVADAILLAYACVAYSATWSMLTQGLDFQPDVPLLFVVNVFVAVLLFLIFYLPLRIPYWIEELAQVKTRGDWLRLAGSILVVMVPALTHG